MNLPSLGIAPGLIYLPTKLSKSVKAEQALPRVVGFTGIVRRAPRLIWLSEKGDLILLSYCPVLVICTIEFYIFCIAIKGDKYTKSQTILGSEI